MFGTKEFNNKSFLLLLLLFYFILFIIYFILYLFILFIIILQLHCNLKLGKIVNLGRKILIVLSMSILETNQNFQE